MSEPITLTTPVGRIVQGEPFKPQTKDAEGRPLVVKTGPNAGQPTTRHFIGLAIAKAEPAFTALQAKAVEVARAGFPQMFDAAGNCTNPNFAFKITDGDSVVPNQKGVKPCDREGFPGHWVIGFSNGFAPKIYTQRGEAIITDPTGMKRGDYVRVNAQLKDNESLQQPGLYWNHNMIELCAYGTEIQAGPSGADVFGDAPTALPQGASATPVASGPPLAQPTQAAPLAPPAAVAPGALPPSQIPFGQPIAGAVAAPPPATDFLNPPAAAAAIVGAAPVASVPMPAPAARAMTAKAAGVPYEKYVEMGWTDVQLKTGGYML